MQQLSVAVVAITISLVFRARELNSFALTQQNKLIQNGSISSTIKHIFPKLFAGNDKIVNTAICMTPTCVHSASKMLELMDSTVDPCEDFYNFACGTFIKETNIPDDKSSVNSFSIIEDKLEEQLRNLVSEKINESEAEPFKLAKRIFNSCMNKTLIEERGTKHFQKVLDSFGGWPVVKGFTWISMNWNLIKSIQHSRANGYSTSNIFEFSVDIDIKNSTKRVIFIDQALTGLSREYLINGMNNTIVQAYFSYMVDMAVLFGANRNNAEKEMRESLDFEIALANISLPQEERRNMSALYSGMTVKELQVKHPYVQWLEYFNALLPKEVQITEEEKIVVGDPNFFDNLGDVLKDTPKRAIANYLMWRVVRSSSYFLTEKLRQRRLKYSTAVYGIADQEPRWTECVDISAEYFSVALGALYVRKHFQKDSKIAASDMVKRIKVEFEKMLKTVPWMDETTRKAALAKARRMATHIGYPEELMDDKKIIEFYKDVTVDENKYFESVYKLNVWGTDEVLKKLREPVIKHDWKNRAYPAEVNAYYNAVENSIQFPAGILQGQFFAVDRPKYLNYGAIGSIIGHEITHGFDDEGRQFDLNGNIVNWWEEETENEYNFKAKCIIEQYGNFFDNATNMTVNGINTQGENIADGGIKQAYLAYKKLIMEIGDDPKLPGLEYSSDQLFWIAAAQTECDVSRTESTKMQITTGVHSPSQFRIMGTFQNMHQFSNDFNCPKNSAMNLEKRCEMW